MGWMWHCGFPGCYKTGIADDKRKAEAAEAKHWEDEHGSTPGRFN